MSEGNLVEVYRARDSVHAHLLRSALENAGIPAMAEGDRLQGAFAARAEWCSAPRIVVEASDATRARALLEEWERVGPSTEPEDRAVRSLRRLTGRCLVAFPTRLPQQPIRRPTPTANRDRPPALAESGLVPFAHGSPRENHGLASSRQARAVACDGAGRYDNFVLWASRTVRPLYATSG